MKHEWILIAVAVAFLAALLLWRLPASNSLPDEVLGIWETSEPKYKDRFFELTRKEVTFGIGNDEANSFLIAGTDKSVEAGKTLFTIRYQDENDVDYKISFYYNPKNRGVIQFKNQKSIKWTKSNKSH